MSETLTAPIENKIEFVTIDEAKSLDKMISKRWVKVDDKGKPVDSKKFFYEVISCHPYERNNVFNPLGKLLIKVEVQKFYRKEFVTVNTRIGNETRPQKQNRKVEQHQFSGITESKFEPGGTWQCVDEDANRLLDIKEFQKQFIVDPSED